MPPKRAPEDLPVPLIDTMKDKPMEERYALAVDAMHASGYHRNGDTKLSLRRAAELYGVFRSTLERRFKGTARPHATAHENQQKLTHAEEDVLVHWARHMASRGVPLTRATMRDYAQKISGKYIGKHWVDSFLKRHAELKIKWSQSLEQCRASALNPTAVAGFFDMIEQIITEYNIPPENIYNMDEKGVQLGVGGSVAGIVDRDMRTVYNIENGNREHVTIIETICADGSVLPPSVIFQGKRINATWGKMNPCAAAISCSPKGWTDQELGFHWLVKEFHPLTQAKNSSGSPRLLILDGHNSHCTYGFVAFAEKENIIIVCLPAHTTHALQPCDVGVFGPLGSCWKKVVNEASRDNVAITKENFLYYYHKAREEAMKETTVKAAFAKCGIHPLNRDAIPASAFTPALNTSSQQVHPFTQLPDLLIPVDQSSSSTNDVHFNTATPSDAINTNTLRSVPTPSDMDSDSESSQSDTDDSSSTYSSNRAPSPPDSPTPTPPGTPQLTPAAIAPLSHVSSASNNATPLSHISSASNNAVSLSASTLPADPLSAVSRFSLAGMPEKLSHLSSKEAFCKQNGRLLKLLDDARQELERYQARVVLLGTENGALRKQLYGKRKDPALRLAAGVRHLTSQESIAELARKQWEVRIAKVHKEARGRFKLLRAAISDHQKMQVLMKKAEADKIRKAKVEEKKRLAQEEKARERLATAARKEAERAAKAAAKPKRVGKKGSSGASNVARKARVTKNMAKAKEIVVEVVELAESDAPEVIMPVSSTSAEIPRPEPLQTPSRDTPRPRPVRVTRRSAQRDPGAGRNEPAASAASTADDTSGLLAEDEFVVRRTTRRTAAK